LGQAEVLSDLAKLWDDDAEKGGWTKCCNDSPSASGKPKDN